MLFSLPLWATILISIVSLFCFFIIFKAIGLRILNSIALAVLVSDIITIVIHPFDVENGVIKYHEGDIFIAIYIIISVLYFLIFAGYLIFKNLITKYCCCKKISKIDKIKEVYDNMNIEEKIAVYDIITESDNKIKNIDESSDYDDDDGNISENYDNDDIKNEIVITPPSSGKYNVRNNMNRLLI